MKHVFVYGSLMFEDIWHAVVKRHYKSMAAQLSGYDRFQVRSESYPGLVRVPGACVQGLVWRSVTAADIRRLDDFEGEYYQRQAVWLETGAGDRLLAETYVFRQAFLRKLTRTRWDPAWFQDYGKQDFIKRYSGFVANRP